MFYEDNNFIVAGVAVVSFLVGGWMMSIYRNYIDSKKPDIDTQIIRIRDKTIKELGEEKQKYICEIMALKGENMEMKQVDQNLEKKLNTLKMWEEKVEHEIEDYKFIKGSVASARLEKHLEEDQQKRNSKKPRAKNSDEEIDPSKKKSDETPKKPKNNP
jgi:hypothetical protein